MRYLQAKAYQEDIKTAIEHTIDFDIFYRKSILILGASGLIGAFITDCFLYANRNFDAGISIYAVSRKKEHLKERFEVQENLKFIETDVTAIDSAVVKNSSFDYIIHAASYGHPKAFREKPAEVLISNVVGTQKVLELARVCQRGRVLYVSSGEAQEQVDHLSARACYPMGKKAAETMCLSYMQEYGSDVVIARPSHIFGANMAAHDNRAAAQFLRAAAAGRDIRMYSAGEQQRSFSYVADCASGLMTILAHGKIGEVYGISAGEECTIREFAGKCAAAGGCAVKMEIPTDVERAEVSPIAEQIVDNTDLKGLGWKPAFSIECGVRRTIRIMRDFTE